MIAAAAFVWQGAVSLPRFSTDSTPLIMLLQGGVEVLSDGVSLVVTSQTVPGGAAAAAGDAQSSGTRVQYASSITTRLLLDCMGHASPVVRQLRWVLKA